MKNSSEIALSVAVVELMSTNRSGWDKFMAALAERLSETTENMVAAPADRVFEFQGAAREARALFKVLHNAPQLVAGLKEKPSGTAPR